MDIRLKQLKELAIDLKPRVREALEECENAKANICRIDLIIMSYQDVKNILAQLEIISANPSKIKDASFISKKLIVYSGNSKWEKLYGLIELGKR